VQHYEIIRREKNKSLHPARAGQSRKGAAKKSFAGSLRLRPAAAGCAFDFLFGAGASGLCMMMMFAAHELSLAQNFTWRTQAAGLASVERTNGVALADYDRDGDLDVYFVVQDSYEANVQKTWNRLFSNRGDGTFFDVTSQAGLAGRNTNATPNPSGMGNKMGASWGDYDNDSWPDLFLTHFGSVQLFHNNGNREGSGQAVTFTDVTSASGISTRRNQLSSSALWFDYDRDGDLDLYISIYAEYFRQPSDRSNKLYENFGNGMFEDVSTASGAADNGLTWMTVALDVNNDHLPDLYVANDFGASRLYLNNGNKTFQEKTVAFGVVNNFHGMGLAIADCDRNGYFDIYLTNITEDGSEEEINPLFLNTGQNYFVNKAVESGVALAGWGWGTEFFDLENDGDEDLFVVTNNFTSKFANVLFRNRVESGAARFERITHEVGLADSIVARGVAIFDYDNDGDSDLLISNFFEAPSLYQNPMTHGNWLNVKLEGTDSNRDALGAVVEVWANGEAYKKYHHGAQFLAQNLMPLRFGLSEAQTIEKIAVTWPSGYVEEIGAVEINQTILIKEKSGVVTGIREASTHQTLSPNTLRLLGNYPNPFNGATQIRFAIRAPGVVELMVYNPQGQIVNAVRETFTTAGEKRLPWNAVDWQSRPLGSGLYFYRLQISGELAEARFGKMLYLK